MATNNNKNRPSNFVILTLMATCDGDMRYSAKGNPWSQVRAFLSQGKDKQTDEYKPSIWFDVKAFGKDGEPSDATLAIQTVTNKQRFTVKGRLAMREWTGEDGIKRQMMEIVATSIEPFVYEGQAEAAPAESAPTDYFDGEFVEDLEGEPA